MVIEQATVQTSRQGAGEGRTIRPLKLVDGWMLSNRPLLSVILGTVWGNDGLLQASRDLT